MKETQQDEITSYYNIVVTKQKKNYCLHHNSTYPLTKIVPISFSDIWVDEPYA